MSATKGMKHPNGSICGATIRACRYSLDVHTEVKITSPEILNASLEKLDGKIADKTVTTVAPAKAQKVRTFFADDSTMTKRDAARNPETSIERLIELSKSKDVLTRMGVSANPATPKSLLAKLALDKDWGVRMAVAKNPYTSRETRELLSRDDNREVLNELARNRTFK
jgi:hypothetical protein